MIRGLDTDTINAVISNCAPVRHSHHPSLRKDSMFAVHLRAHHDHHVRYLIYDIYG